MSVDIYDGSLCGASLKCGDISLELVCEAQEGCSWDQGSCYVLCPGQPKENYCDGAGDCSASDFCNCEEGVRACKIPPAPLNLAATCGPGETMDDCCDACSAVIQACYGSDQPGGKDVDWEMGLSPAEKRRCDEYRAACDPLYHHTHNPAGYVCGRRVPPVPADITTTCTDGGEACCEACVAAEPCYDISIDLNSGERSISEKNNCEGYMPCKHALFGPDLLGFNASGYVCSGSVVPSWQKTRVPLVSQSDFTEACSHDTLLSGDPSRCCELCSPFLEFCTDDDLSTALVPWELANCGLYKACVVFRHNKNPSGLRCAVGAHAVRMKLAPEPFKSFWFQTGQGFSQPSSGDFYSRTDTTCNDNVPSIVSAGLQCMGTGMDDAGACCVINPSLTGGELVSARLVSCQDHDSQIEYTPKPKYHVDWITTSPSGTCATSCKSAGYLSCNEDAMRGVGSGPAAQAVLEAASEKTCEVLASPSSCQRHRECTLSRSWSTSHVGFWLGTGCTSTDCGTNKTVCGARGPPIGCHSPLVAQSTTTGYNLKDFTQVCACDRVRTPQVFTGYVTDLACVGLAKAGIPSPDGINALSNPELHSGQYRSLADKHPAINEF